VSAPPQFATREFFNLARNRLNDDGVLIANFYGSLAPDSRATVYAVLRTMREAFPQVYVVATANPASEVLQNFIFIGHNAARRVDLRRADAVAFAYPMLRDIAARELRPSEALLQAYPVLTDDYAPLEYYAANTIRRYDAISTGRRAASW